MLTATIIVSALTLSAAAPWDGAPFQGSPDAIRAAAAALKPPPDAAVDLLLEETTYAVDAQGRWTFQWHIVFRPLTRAAAAEWSSLGMGWSPWYQDRPELRARVIGSGGELHTLDPSSVFEAATDAPGAVVFTDGKALRAPLPGVDVGAVVEETVTVREHAPFFEGGNVRRYYLGREGIPSRRVRLRIEAPAELPLTWHGAGGIPGAPRETRAGGVHALRWEWADVPRQRPIEPGVPPEAHPRPLITFTTAGSWAAVADRYAELVEQQLAGEDLTATARAIVAPDDPPRVAAQKALDWMSARVRYTGLQLGSAAIVPARPSETLRRRFGDCKDLALVLTALLRAAGHPASLALLRTGWDEIDPAVPGMGTFDHAIVHVAGETPFYVDATSPSTRVGALPAADQGRFALVVARGASELGRTPEATARDNTVAVRREVFLSDNGLARVVQRTEARGEPSARVRAWARRLADDVGELRKKDEAATLEFLHATKLVASTLEGLDSDRVTLRREVDGSRIAVSSGDTADAVVPPREIFQSLPGAVLPAQNAGTEPASTSERRADLWVDEPVTSALEYRIVPPPGFHVTTLPAGERRSVGPLAYESTFAEVADGSVTATYRVVLDVRRISPADLKRIREALVRLMEPNEPRLHFRRLSAELLDAGKGRAALDELRRLGALHPSEPRYHNLLAMALLRLGMAEGARAEARRSVALDPANEWSHRVLAVVLASDLAGRFLHAGCDLAGAVAAQRRAVALKPEPSTRARLASLLQYGARCERFADGARLDEALALHRILHDEAKGEFDDDYAEALLGAGRFGEARTLARSMKPSPARAAALLAGAAVEGAAALAQETEALSAADRRGAIRPAWEALARRRMYPELAVLLRGAAEGLETAASLRSAGDAFARVHVHPEAVALDPADPATLPRRVLRAILADDPSHALAPLLLQPAADVEGTVADLRRFRQGYARSWGVPDRGFLDVVDSLIRTSVRGDPASGARLDTELGGDSRWTVGAVVQDGTVRMAYGRAGAQPLAAVARRRLEARDLAGARAVLALVPINDLPSDDEASTGSVVRALWLHGQDAGLDELHDVALALEAPSSSAALGRLLAARNAAEGGRRRALTWALAGAYVSLQRPNEVLALVEPVLAEDPRSAGAFRLQYWALRKLHRDAALRSAAEARLRAMPDDPAALRVLVQVALGAADGEGAVRYARALAGRESATPSDHNQLAWSALLLPSLPADALGAAQRAVSLSKERSRPELHTLATVHAARGEPEQARQVLLKAIELEGEMGPPDWLVMGKIAEQYGLVDDALAAYRRAEKDAADATVPLLARTWSAALRRR